MWNKKVSRKETISNFFDGESFNNKLLNSLFGKFMNIISSFTKNEDIKEIINNLPLPKVIVIGSESSGKSSLLENILKCSIFPRNSIICTKQPIHLILKTAKNTSEIYYKITYKSDAYFIEKAEDIVTRIADIMNTLSIDEISEEEIHIEICNLKLPNFEFYDLPGIRAYPEKLAHDTLKLTEKYLQMSNTIVLCVVPATTPRITSYLPIALIKKYNKEKNSIIALTMTDRVQQDNIYDLLVKRIINSTDEYDQNNFAGCVAIINRSHINNKSLEENDIFSNEWFYDNIISEIPNDFLEENTKLIKKNIGIQNLINNLDEIYNKYINETWIPNTISDLKKNIIEIENKKNILGDHIEDYDGETQQEILNLVIKYTLDRYSKLLSPLIDSNRLYSESTKYHVNVRFDDFNEYLNTIKYLSRSFLFDAKDFNENGFFHNYTNNSGNNELNIYNYTNNLLYTFFLKDELTANYPLNKKYNITRFTYLIEIVKQCLNDRFNEKMCEYIEINKYKFFQYYLDVGSSSAQQIVTTILNGINSSFLHQIKKLVIDETKIYVTNIYTKFYFVNMTELLKEDENITELRDKYNLELINIKKSISEIESLAKK